MHFATYFHPHICEFIRALNRDGVQYLLTLANQQLTDSADPSQQPTFHGQYSPVNQHVLTPYPLEDVDFDYCGAYSLYNWELFFHIPMLIATKLSKNQRFEEAQQWFHYIFNPTDFSSDGTSDSSPRHYWRVLPFNRNTENERIQDLLKQLNGTSDNGTSNSDCKHDINVQIEEWRHNPFNPHLIARMRLIAYQKSVVMKYIDNLIAWGDQLFQQDSMESINEATQLYILAYEMLGPLPEQIPAQGTIKPVAYADVPWDSFSNAQVSLENYIQADGSQSSTSINGSNSGSSSGSSLGSTFYFCIPKNDKLLGYWNTVADRLFKIRHCMNIEGVVRQLPLFAPPIDPALLVQAAAMGVDLTSALNDINAATPHYRFTYILPKALELCGELRAFGGALLSALEKKDAEAIAALRASQETNMLKAARLVKEQQLEEAKTTLDGLKKTRQVTEIRYNFYNTIQFMNDWETTHLVLVGVGAILQAIEGVIESASSGAHLIPDVTVGVSGWAGTPVTTVKYGGSNSGGALQGFARALGVLAALANTAGSMSATMGGYQRRADEWQLQVNLASKELEQIDKQIAAADIRTAIAQKELDNHDKQIENAAAIEDFLRDKYTNQDLYDWMVGQISAVYFQCYKMAYDIAKRVEQAFRFERGLSSSDFITFGYWDSLKKGLLAGEQLYLDLKRLDMAYLDQNKREYEITKHISLVFFDPMALITLKETGTCIVDLPEALFDMDYPGHYMRRIKSVSLTIPCVTGPYTSINCTLTLQKNTIRKNSNLNLASDPKDPYSGPKDDDDALSRFITTFGAIESIATSTAQNDSGMFEVNFRDERYLPFEGAGVVSTWRIDMPQDCNSFDFETISDVIMKLNYTAREGGTQLGNLAKAAAQLPPITPQKMRLSQQNTVFPNQDNLQRLFSAKHEFPSDWYRLLHLTDSTKSQQMTLDLTQERFPFQYRNKNITINKLTLFLDLKDGATYDEGKQFAFDLNHKDNAIASGQHFTAQGSPVPNLPFVSIPSDQQALNEPVNQDTWSLANVVNAKPDIINDLWIVCQFTVINKNGSY